MGLSKDNFFIFHIFKTESCTKFANISLNLQSKLNQHHDGSVTQLGLINETVVPVYQGLIQKALVPTYLGLIHETVAPSYPGLLYEAVVPTCQCQMYEAMVPT